MNKFLIMLFSLLTVVMLSSCDEVKDSPLLFKATSNTNPEYISVSYYPEEIGITLAMIYLLAQVIRKPHIE